VWGLRKCRDQSYDVEASRIPPAQYSREVNRR
jgi:hypothetical protein